MKPYEFYTKYYYKPISYKYRHPLYNGSLKKRYIIREMKEINSKARYVIRKSKTSSLLSRYLKFQQFNFSIDSTTEKIHWEIPDEKYDITIHSPYGAVDNVSNKLYFIDSTTSEVIYEKF